MMDLPAELIVSIMIIDKGIQFDCPVLALSLTCKDYYKLQSSYFEAIGCIDEGSKTFMNTLYSSYNYLRSLKSEMEYAITSKEISFCCEQQKQTHFCEMSSVLPLGKTVFCEMSSDLGRAENDKHIPFQSPPITQLMNNYLNLCIDEIQGSDWLLSVTVASELENHEAIKTMLICDIAISIAYNTIDNEETKAVITDFFGLWSDYKYEFIDELLQNKEVGNYWTEHPPGQSSCKLPLNDVYKRFQVVFEFYINVVNTFFSLIGSSRYYKIENINVSAGMYPSLECAVDLIQEYRELDYINLFYDKRILSVLNPVHLRI